MKYKFGDNVKIINNKFYKNITGTIIAFLPHRYPSEVYTIRLNTKDNLIVNYTENTHFLEKIKS